MFSKPLFTNAGNQFSQKPAQEGTTPTFGNLFLNPQSQTQTGLLDQNNPLKSNSSSFGPNSNMFTGAAHPNVSLNQDSCAGLNSFGNSVNQGITASKPSSNIFLSNSSQQSPPGSKSKENYPTIPANPMFKDLPRSLNMKVNHSDLPGKSNSSRIKCIAAIDENLKNQKNKEMLRVEYYSSNLGLSSNNSINYLDNSKSIMNSNSSCNNQSATTNIFSNAVPSNNPSLSGNLGQTSNIFGQQQPQQNGLSFNSQPSSGLSSSGNIFQNSTNSNPIGNSNSQSQSQSYPSLFKTANNQAQALPFAQQTSAILRNFDCSTFYPRISSSNLYGSLSSPDQSVIPLCQSVIAQPLPKPNYSYLFPHQVMPPEEMIKDNRIYKHSIFNSRTEKVSIEQLFQMISKANSSADHSFSYSMEQSYNDILDLHKKYHYMLELQAWKKSEWEMAASPYSMFETYQNEFTQESSQDSIIQANLTNLFGSTKEDIDQIMHNRPLVQLLMLKKDDIETYLSRKIVHYISQPAPPFFLILTKEQIKKKKNPYEEVSFRDERGNLFRPKLVTELEERQQIDEGNKPFGHNWFQDEIQEIPNQSLRYSIYMNSSSPSRLR